METYEALRSFAGVWGLLLGVVVFVGIIIWVFRPGARKAQDDAARQIFRNEDAPAAERPDRGGSGDDSSDGSKKDQGNGH